jgi:hypothetical protein
MNKDFVEMLAALSDAQAEFLIVGAHALASHGYPRATGDLDVWVRASEGNASKVWRALQAFGAPTFDLTQADLAQEGVVFQMGLPPRRIDLLTSISGVEFGRAWENRTTVNVAGMDLPVLGRAELIENKRASGRAKDLADVAELERREKP